MRITWIKKYCNVPFYPSSFPVFYGWVILIAGTIGILMSIPGQTMGVSVFTENLLNDLDINRNNLSLAYLIGTIGSGLLITRAGKLYDQFGARVMGFMAGGILGLMLLFLTRVDKAALLLNHRFSALSIELTTFLLMIIGFWGIRFFGQGLLTMVSRNMVMKWFDKRRGFANGIMGLFISFGFSYAPKLLNQFIEHLEWKGTWTLLSIILGIGFVSFVLIFYRDNPMDCFCKPDGRRPFRIRSNRPPSLPHKDYSLKEAKKTTAFWALSLTMALNALYISGLTFHVVSVFDSAGMDKNTAINIFLPASMIAIIIQFAGGWLSDYIRIKYFIILYTIALMTTSMSLIFLGEHPASFWLVITGNGISWGMYVVLSAVTWPRFFGLTNLGAISGYALSWMVIGSAFGPYLFSLSLNLTGTYDWAGLFTFMTAFILFIISFKADNPALKLGD